MLNFNLNKKLIGACCISPIMIAKVFSGQKVEITLGKKIQNVILNLNQSQDWPYYSAIEVAESLGAYHQDREVDEICVDKERGFVTTPAYNYAKANSFQVYRGIEKMVEMLVCNNKQIFSN